MTEVIANKETWQVIVGSRNPTKVEAVRQVLQRVVAQQLLPLTALEVRGIEVPSGVSVQPIGQEETRQGAIGRARNALASAEPNKAKWGVGIEGGIVRLEEGWFTTAWSAIVDQNGLTSFGGGLMMPLPPPIVRDLDAGYELGEATDRLFQVQNSKHAGGALGHLSKGLHSRQAAYEAIFIYALTKFLNLDLYAPN